MYQERLGSLIFLIFQIISLHKCVALSVVGSRSGYIEGVLVRKVPYGGTVVLKCRSNDRDHNFMYWNLINRNIIIGPANKYDDVKFRYEILSGNLTIRGVSKREEGLYSCVSRAVIGNTIKTEYVEMLVHRDWEDVYEHDSNINLIRVLFVLIVLVVLAGVGYFAYRIWKDRYRYPRYLEPDDEDDDDESAEELFTAPSTSGLSKMGKSTPPAAKVKENEGFENIDISTDFKSFLDTANNK